MHHHPAQTDLREGQDERDTNYGWIWAALARSLAGKGQWQFLFHHLPVNLQLWVVNDRSCTFRAAAVPNHLFLQDTPWDGGFGVFGRLPPSTSVAFVLSLKLSSQEWVAAWGSYFEPVFCIFLQSPLRIPFILGKKPTKGDWCLMVLMVLQNTTIICSLL